MQRHVGPAGVDRHVLGRLLDQRGQIHRGHLGHRLAAVAGLGAVQLTQLQNVADQRDHPLCLLVDARGEGRHVGGLCHAGLDQLGIAGNARQRGFQLVADVGRELAAHRLVVLAQLAVRLDRPRQRDQFFIRHIGLDRVEMLGQMVVRPYCPRQSGSHQLNSVAASKISTTAPHSSGRVSVLRPQMFATSSPTRSTCAPSGRSMRTA